MGGGGGGDGGAGEQKQEEERKEALRQKVNALYMSPEAQARFATEEDQLSKAHRDYYSADLKDRYGETERNLRFGASNTGQTGGSVYADEMAKMNEQNALGGTRIDEAVRRAVNGLRNSREESRARSIQLINAGEGESGVQAAQSALQQSIEGAKAGQKEQLFTDLFSNLALARQSGGARALDDEASAYYARQRGGAYYPTTPSNSGTIIRGS